MAVLRHPVRSRPIRLFLIGMFAIPLVSLVGLWAFAASITVPSAVGDHNFNITASNLNADSKEFASELPVERAETYVWLLSDRKAPKASLLATRKLMDKAVPAEKNALHFEYSLLSGPTQAALNAFFTSMGQLGSIRAAVDSGAMQNERQKMPDAGIAVDDETERGAALGRGFAGGG